MALPEETVSVIIVTHNSQPALDSCLEALVPALDGLSTELVVVDNNSDNDPTKSITDHFPHARIIRLDRNTGFGSACNRGARETEGTYLLFINPDVIVDTDAVRILLDTCRHDDKAGLVAGRLRFPDGSFQATCRNFPTAGNLIFSRGSFLSKLFGGSTSGDKHRYTLPDYDRTTHVPAVAGTLLMVRRRLFEKAGGFDERFFMFMEDTDLSLRIHRAGYHNVFVPEAGGIHHWGTGSSASRFKRTWRHHYSLWQYFLKHEPNAFALFVLPLFLLANVVLVSILPHRHHTTN